MPVSSFDLVKEKVIGSGLIFPLKTNNKMIEILSYQFLKKKYWGSYISIIVDETSDVSKLEQFSISDNYLDCKGAKQERFSKFT